jgi:uncharacterized repeat protein (TIGR02543 family)
LQKGFVTVNVGMRGNTANTGTGADTYRWGKLPNPIVDLKASLRYLHFNDANMPGDADKIIVIGTSSGGSATVQLGTSGNTALYNNELAAIGAYMGSGARDDIWMAGPSCPVMMRGNADPVIAWALFGDLTDAVADGANPTASALNKALSIEGIRYFNTLGLRAEYAVPSAGIAVGDLLTSSNYGAYVLPAVRDSAMYYLNVQMSNAGNRAAIMAYLAGSDNNVRRDSYLTPVFDADDKLVDIEVTSWVDFWRSNSSITGNGVATGTAPNPLNVWSYQFDAPAFNTTAITSNGVLTSGTGSPSTQSFGYPGENGSIYSPFGIAWATSNKGVNITDQARLDLLEFQRNSVDPMYFLLEKEAGRQNVDVAPYWCIRTGSADFVTPPYTIYALTTKLENMGKDVDTLLTWRQGHGTTNDTAGFFSYIEEALAEKFIVTFDAGGGDVSPANALTRSNGILKKALPVPVRAGHVFDGWYTTLPDGEKVTASTVFAADTTVYAAWSLPVTSVKIGDGNGLPLSALTSVPRNSKLMCGIVVNDGANVANTSIIWMVSDPSFATVDEYGLVTIKNKIGTVILTVRDTDSGLTSTIVIRIT